jgi:xanthine dehydrogenase YagS FAD-binding subunit
MKRFAWIEAHDLDGACAAAAKKGTLVKAGGVDLADRLKEGLDEPAALVNIRNVKELSFLRAEDAGLAIGPLITLQRLSTDAAVLKSARALAQAAGAAATPQIRNMATLGGNLAQRPRCWYFRSGLFPCRKKGGDRCFAIEGEHEFHSIFQNDLCAAVSPSATGVALVALDAKLKLKSAASERALPAEELFIASKTDPTKETVLEHGELIAAVSVPSGRRSAYQKLMQKQSFDWPLVEVAVALSMDGDTVKEARIALGSVAPTPWRAKEAEKELRGKQLTPELAEAVARLATEGATPLPRNAYKVPLVRAVVRRTLLQAKEDGA